MKRVLPLDIGGDEYEIVQSILNRHVPDIEVRAFGSRVKGSARQYSDLDLAIMTQSPLSLSQLAELREPFSESDLPWKVDLVDWAWTNEEFRTIIQRDSVIIQQKA